jgi:signal transduction histidine kinase
VVTIFINRYLLTKLWQPFYQTLRTISSFKVTNTTPIHLPPTNTDEFPLLNHHIEQTISDAQKEYQLLKEFTENGSHEIQTPLSILQSKLDLFIQSEDLQ